MVLSDEAQAAMRRGSTLQIAWLADEPMAASLAGSEQGIVDLKTCGAQVSAQYRDRQAMREVEQALAAAGSEELRADDDDVLLTYQLQTERLCWVPYRFPDHHNLLATMNN